MQIAAYSNIFVWIELENTQRSKSIKNETYLSQNLMIYEVSKERFIFSK